MKKTSQWSILKLKNAVRTQTDVSVKCTVPEKKNSLCEWITKLFIFLLTSESKFILITQYWAHFDNLKRMAFLMYDVLNVWRQSMTHLEEGLFKIQVRLKDKLNFRLHKVGLSPSKKVGFFPSMKVLREWWKMLFISC